MTGGPHRYSITFDLIYVTEIILNTCAAELLAASVHEKAMAYVPAVLVSTEP